MRVDGDEIYYFGLLQRQCNSDADPVLMWLRFIQIEDCRTRYNGETDQHMRRKKFSFPARLFCGDCFEVTHNFGWSITEIVSSVLIYGLFEK